MSEPTEQGVEPRLYDYLRPVVERRWFILACVVLATVATYVYYDRQPDVYGASTSIFVTASNSNPLATTPLSTNDRTIQSQAVLLRSRAVAARVARRLRFKGSPDQLLGAIAASPAVGSDFVQISARWGTAQGAADIANAFAAEFIATRSSEVRTSNTELLQRLRQQRNRIPMGVANEAERANIGTQIRLLELSLELPSGGTQQVDAATPPGAPLEPNPRRNAIFAALLALLGAIAVAYGLDRFDRRIRRVEETSEVYGLPLLSAVPHVSHFGRDGEAPAGFVEAFRLLQTNVRLAQVDRELRVVVVTSAIPGEGKSTVVRYLAEAFTEWGKSVAIIDADLRRSSISATCGIATAPGLTELVAAPADDGAVEEAMVEIGARAIATIVDEDGAVAQGSGGQAVITRTGAAPGATYARLSVLPAGTTPPHPAALLAATRTRDVIAGITERHDVVIIDTPPVLAVSDAMALVPLADAVILVSRVNVTKRDDAKRVVETLRRIPGAQLAGVVANDVSANSDDSYGYYG